MVDWISAIPGGIAILGVAATWGSMRARLMRVERDVADLKDVQVKVAVIEERTGATVSAIEGIRSDIGKITDHFLSEARSFAGEIVRRERRGAG